MSRPKFLADEMLGSLARWLRIMGYDTSYAHDVSDGEVLSRAQAEGRTILTRDHQLAERARESGLLIVGDDLEGQLGQVVSAYRLSFEEELTRCTLCNGALREMREGEEEILPPKVRSSQETPLVCCDCGQMYWKGSHWDKIYERLDRVLGLRSDSNPR